MSEHCLERSRLHGRLPIQMPQTREDLSQAFQVPPSFVFSTSNCLSGLASHPDGGGGYFVWPAKGRMVKAAADRGIRGKSLQIDRSVDWRLLTGSPVGPPCRLATRRHRKRCRRLEVCPDRAACRHDPRGRTTGLASEQGISLRRAHSPRCLWSWLSPLEARCTARRADFQLHAARGGANLGPNAARRMLLPV